MLFLSMKPTGLEGPYGAVVPSTGYNQYYNLVF